MERMEETGVVRKEYERVYMGIGEVREPRGYVTV